MIETGLSRPRSALLLAAAIALGAGCNTYDPNLGPTPFLCGAGAPRCPAGYDCVPHEDQEICLAKGTDPPPDGSVDPDAASFACADDSEIEPNDTPAESTNTLIPVVQDEYRLVGLSICPDTDEDFFRFDVDEAGRNVRVDLQYLAERGQILVEVHDAANELIREGESVGGDGNLVRVEVPDLAQGTYLIQVRAPVDIENNYALEIALSGD